MESRYWTEDCRWDVTVTTTRIHPFPSNPAARRYLPVWPIQCWNPEYRRDTNAAVSQPHWRVSKHVFVDLLSLSIYSTWSAGNNRISFSMAATRPAPCSNSCRVIPPGPGPTSIINSRGTLITSVLSMVHPWPAPYLNRYILFSMLPAHATNLLVARGSSRKFCANRRNAGNL